MSCYRCGTRQVDPDRGESPWKRGVRADRQVLICPACQGAFDWMSELDRCPVCSGARLVRRLGEVECKDCGSVRDPAASSALTPVPVPDERPGLTPGLAEEVQQALDRVLGKTRRPAGIS
jgi:hypothetical protein